MSAAFPAPEPPAVPSPPPLPVAFAAPVGPRIESVADVPFFEPVAHEPGAVPEVPVPRLGRRGRHYVPDELVQAATHRLPADRVARAKVPPPAEAPEEPPQNPVPKPRTS
jgi:hypothetical protein